ncbi:hypothetical protein K491DRAFT_766147 [Lophiostoma macrostomum CBS 122681]|uniref:C2H2-type domain-containing protein n=1 Tax=Lophiostoma macrostomum CBS 122681 TaxID=1314788 RepID=A0A6A6TJ25_9PLEO|nr:hypothetical protein K491DRAFT_766147 [Lophiostoma macrostomum CBS 122681]
MALKRKELGIEEPLPDKRFRRDAQPENDNPYREFKQNGERRAESEMRYTWKYICDFEGCGQRFNRPSRLDDHMRTHTKEKLPCTFADCDKSFTRHDHLKRHLRAFHSEVPMDRPFMCDWEDCGKRFITRQHLTGHIKTHETKYYCRDYPPCKEVFRKQKTLDAHIKSKHLSLDPYPCPFVDEETGEHCTKGYQTHSALRGHQSTSHENKKDNTYYCFACPVPGTEVEVIEMETGETQEIPREPLPFANYPALTTHMRECHPPTCKDCGRKFKSDGNLKEHMKFVHGPEEDRPKFPCPHDGCGKVFVTAHNRKTHVESVHEKRKKFYCDKSFFVDSKKSELADWDGKNACRALYASKAAVEQHVRTQHLNLKNRKETRKEKKSKAMPAPPILALLTGEGDKGSRDITCLISGCDRRYFLDRDLRRHLRSKEHGLDAVTIDEMILERNARQGGNFWVGGADQLMPESTEPSVPQTPQLLQDLNAMNNAMPYTDEDFKPLDSHLSLGEPADFQKLSLHQQEDDDENEFAKMDADMGLANLEPVDASYGLPPFK